MASHPERQFSLVGTKCTSAICHMVHNSASRVTSPCCAVCYIVRYALYETTTLPVLLYGSLICSLSVSKERIVEQNVEVSVLSNNI
jgi:hypothetical protein